MNDERPGCGAGGRDLHVPGGGGVEAVVDPDAEKREARGGRRADPRVFSPTPPVNTSASSPPRAAAIAAMPARSRCR